MICEIPAKRLLLEAPIAELDEMLSGRLATTLALTNVGLNSCNPINKVVILRRREQIHMVVNQLF